MEKLGPSCGTLVQGGSYLTAFREAALVNHYGISYDSRIWFRHDLSFEISNQHSLGVFLIGTFIPVCFRLTSDPDPL